VKFCKYKFPMLCFNLADDLHIIYLNVLLDTVL